MVYITICVEEVEVFLIFVDLFIPCFEVTLVRDFMIFKNFFLEYMMGLWGWCMRYDIPYLIARKAGSVGAFMYPLRHMVRY